jgi:protein-L-isoaspartate(D-aspartate) O-methyltransferase
LLAQLAETVVSIERVRALSDAARTSLERAGIRGPMLVVSDGTLGWQPLAPYDAIAVSAASPDVPEPLLRQLVPGGRLVIPIGDRDHQVLTLVRRTQDGVERTSLADARFVPLIGEHGWDGH